VIARRRRSALCAAGAPVMVVHSRNFIQGERVMFVKFTSADRVATVVNAAQVTFISPVEDGTRIRFGEGRSVTVVEPMDEVLERLNRTQSFPPN
jgi:hypothetical protein